jgi:NAD(P)-dependent dehydrogenase (short-subunit alcohol dehydrogenase family)
MASPDPKGKLDGTVLASANEFLGIPDCKKSESNPVNPRQESLLAQREPDVRQIARQVLVTGGAHRLGAEICEHFARAGWNVLCHYHQSQEAAQTLCQGLQTRYGVQASAVGAALGEPTARAAMMATIAAQHGRVHCLVNNASMFLPDMGVDFQEGHLLEHLRVNLVAPLALARDIAAMLGNQPAQAGTADFVGSETEGSLSVIHVLDQKVYNLNPDYFSYTVSKLALERTVALQAQALAPKVRVCGVAPGLLYLSGDQTPDNFALASRANLLRRAIAPSDVAKTCLFLAETPSITGTSIQVDNGQHLVAANRDIMFLVDELIRHPTP